MKTSPIYTGPVIALLMVSIMPCAALQGADDDEVREILADWEQAINQTPDVFDPEYVAMLGDGLRKLSRPRPTYQEKRRNLFLEAQRKMLSIPGHAQFFADELERLRTVLPETDDGYKRSIYIAQTLIHMPSPETIKVLGNYLHDERDVPPQRKWTPENAHLAAYALSRIGLRDFPFKGPLVPASLTIWPDLNQLPDYRAWWEEVKSGQRTFSFKGQAVEYRFRPDGTWETIPIANPPDDGPKPVPAATEPENPTSQTDTADTAKPDDRSMWWWIAGAGGLLIVVACGLFRKSRKVG